MSNAHLKDLDVEIFDDDDFYHQVSLHLLSKCKVFKERHLDMLRVLYFFFPIIQLRVYGREAVAKRNV